MPQSSAADIVTRQHLTRTGLGAGHARREADLVTTPAQSVTSLATRRQRWLGARRRKRVLLAIAVVLAIFPPMWVVYLVAWLVWRSRPRQQSMRGVRKAVRSLERDQTGSALKLLQEAHLQDPSNSDALYWLGLLLSRQNRQEEAAEVLSVVAERVPGLPEVESALVEAYIAMGEGESAIFHAQRLLDVEPYALTTLLKLADAFEAAGRLDLAAKALEQAPLHKPVLTEDLLQLHYRLGTLYEQQGDSA